ncbi:platelet-activating factor acetylhydrolase, isoform II-domain-containing protein [Pestalotiopsis sp. NC0098]|nr:platelet-activating factor acetylhydrolase, isoform II-domain-containing protein [Pestalotiopsis sp. NC0098]
MARFSPRLAIRYLLVTFIAMYAFKRWFSGQPLLSDSLPAYSGPYDVGTVDIEVPAVQPRKFSDAVHKETGEPAFQLETVMFSIFYPAERGIHSKKPKHTWIPESGKLYAEGYARFAGISTWLTNKMFEGGLWSLVGSTTIPAQVDVPIHGAGEHQKRDVIADEEGQAVLVAGEHKAAQKDQFPVIVFSHGMASGRTSYTHYLGELASRGYIVAAVEHRDGSGPGTIVYKADGTQKTVFHAPAEALVPVPETEELKRVQLALRQAEVEETVRVLRAVNNGDGQDIHRGNTRKEGDTLVYWRHRLNFDQIIMAGHSYGATLAMQALKGSPNELRPFVGGIALDPGKSSGPLNANIDVPLLVIHSQSWSSKRSIFFGRPHFDTVKEIVEGIVDKRHGNKKAGWFMTAKGTTHPTVTDAPLIEPLLLSWTTGATVDVKEGLMQYVQASKDFLSYLVDGKTNGVIGEHVSHPRYNHETRKPSDEMGKIWQIHVSPIE